MISAHLPALQVVVPLLAAPVCLLLRNRHAAWLLAALVTWATFIIALGLLAQVADRGTLSYAIGDWAPPWGIEYRVDLFGALVLVIVSGIGSLVMPFARINVEREIPAERIYLSMNRNMSCGQGICGRCNIGPYYLCKDGPDLNYALIKD